MTFANLRSEAQGFVSDYLLTDEQRDDVLRLLPNGNTINLDRAAQIIQAQAAEISKLRFQAERCHDSGCLCANHWEVQP